MLLQSKVFIFFTILLFLIFFEWFYFSKYRSKVFKEEMSERGSILVRTFAQLSREPLLSLQITRLEHQLDSLLEEKDVLSAQIYTMDYKILAATDREQEGWSYSGEIVTDTEINFEEDIMITRTPIIILNKKWGMAEIIFSLNNMKLKINQSKKIFILIFVFEFILAIFFAIFLQIQIVRPLSKLAQEVKQITPDSLQGSLSHLKFTASEIVRVRHSIDNMRKKLKQAQEEIISKTQFATMGKIAANITHEIRNPLEAISGVLEILSDEKVLKKDGRKYLIIIQDEIHNLNDYLNEFLEFVRAEPNYSDNVQINNLIKDCFILLQPMLKKNKVKVDFNLKEDIPLCTIDINQIKRVIINLLLNSIEAIDKKAKLWISTAKKENSILIVIRDNGKGIYEEHLPHVFDLYFTTKKSGSGIGLALCKKIIDQHKGSIQIKSIFGEGTIVTIQLPIK